MAYGNDPTNSSNTGDGGINFGSSRTTSKWNKNRVDPFYGYGALNQAGMSGLRGGEEYGQQNFGAALAGQNRALAGYEAMAAGQGPSLAESMMARTMGQNIAAQQSMQAQAGGAGAFRNAQRAGQAQAVAGAQALAEIRAQEQQQAMAGAAGLSSQMAGQGLQQQLGYAGMLNQAQLGQMQAAADFQLQQRALQEQERMGRFQRRMGWANFGVSTGGKVVEAIGSAVSASDERLKTGIVPGSGSASELAAASAPIEFDYQPGAGPEGRRIGVSAQQLEQSPAGRALVIDTPAGKMVDTGQAALAGLAISGDQEQRLRALEQRAPAGMSSTPTMAAQPQVMQPREVIHNGNADYTIDHQLAAEADAARQRLAQTDAAIESMRAGTLAPMTPPPRRFDAGSVGQVRAGVGAEIDRMQAEYDASNPFGVPGGSSPMESTSVSTGQSMGKAGGGGGGGVGAGMMGFGAALGGGGGMGGGGGGFGGGMQGFGAAFSDERRKRNITSASALGSTISQQKVRNAGGY